MQELINRRINQILVHSYLYEILGEPIISDVLWDKWAKELSSLLKQYPEAIEEHPYGKAFKDWTGDTASVLIPFFDETIKRRAMLAKACKKGR
jgi:hypothetical protein